MNSRIFKDYIKSLFPEFKYLLGIEDKENEKTISIYHRSGTAGQFTYGTQDSQLFPITLILTGNGNYADTEIMVLDIYYKLAFLNDVEFEDIVFSIFPKNEQLPVYLGKTESGFYQFAIDLNLIFTK